MPRQSTRPSSGRQACLGILVVDRRRLFSWRGRTSSYVPGRRGQGDSCLKRGRLQDNGNPGTSFTKETVVNLSSGRPSLILFRCFHSFFSEQVERESQPFIMILEKGRLLVVYVSCAYFFILLTLSCLLLPYRSIGVGKERRRRTLPSSPREGHRCEIIFWAERGIRSLLKSHLNVSRPPSPTRSVED